MDDVNGVTVLAELKALVENIDLNGEYLPVIVERLEEVKTAIELNTKVLIELVSTLKESLHDSIMTKNLNVVTRSSNVK